MAVSVYIALWLNISAVVLGTPPVRPGTGNQSARLPRTSARQLSQLNNGTAGIKQNVTKNDPAQRNGNLRTR